ncbi:MAG: sensor histidine kinase, partial [Candidatus Binatia bacterium]
LILYGSPSTWRALGYALEEFVGRSAFELIHPDDHAFVRGQLAESLRQPGTGVPVQAWVRHKSGSWRWLEGSFTNLLAEPGVQAIVNNYRDMTERKRAEKELARQAAELQRSNTELEQFAYIASHDLQEPLRTVNNFTQLLAKRYQGNLDADADEFMGYITEGATRMQQLIRDLLAYSQVGKQGQEFTPTDCEAVLERTLHMLQMRIEESGGQVTHAPLPTLAVDAGQLEQLFQNLIGNALKFRGPEPPRVHVSAQQNGRQWVFSVRDNGIGLDPQQAERIFQVFQRLHTRKAYPGTGIGLAICKKIVEQHGGRIWVESQPGQGATFFFTISDMGGGVNLLTRRVMNPYFSS